jgi:hypothetical protein
METRTLLRDFQSHNQSRSVYTVEKGLVVKANRIRLLDFNIYIDKGFTQLQDTLSLHPLAGVYSLVKKISFLNLEGQEIDSMSNCVNNMALRLLHMDNGAQRNISPMMNNTSNTFINFDSKTISNTVVANSPSTFGLYIDLANMLNYLNVREYISEGFTIVVEWNAQSVWAPSVADPLYISSPTLAIDEVLTVSAQQVEQKPVMFATLVNDQIALSTSLNPQTRRLNSFYNQFISNLYYLNNVNTLPYRGLGFSASQGETFEITIDGRKLLPLKGVDSPARKIALLTDFTGDCNLVNGSYVRLANQLDIESVNHDNAPTIVFDNNMSFGCIKLDRFIQNDMTLSYSRVNADDVNLFIVAEVLKMYDPKSGLLSYVRQ